MRTRSHARSAILGTAVACVLGFAVPAQAQTIRNTGVNRTQVDLGFVGNVRNSIILTIIGTGTTTISGEQSRGMPTHASATIDFGTFSTQLQPPPSNGTGYRVALPSPGAVVAATLDAMVTYNGAATASLTVGRLMPAGGLPDVPLADLRVASPALATWTAGTQGVPVPNAGLPGYNICTAAGDLTCLNAKPYNHSIAMFLPDTRLAGPVTTAIVITGTMP
jgi:hypothetical protein